jgi:hypothetical protein
MLMKVNKNLLAIKIVTATNKRSLSKWCFFSFAVSLNFFLDKKVGKKSRQKQMLRCFCQATPPFVTGRIHFPDHPLQVM